MLRGTTNLFTSVGIESLLGSRDWFSQVLGPNNFGVSAIGQASLTGKGARLNWLLSTRKADGDPLPELIEHMSLEAGTRGAHFITAGARVDDCLFETLRRSGYCIYSWQSIWNIDADHIGKTSTSRHQWRQAFQEDTIGLEALQRKLLAPSVQSVTEFASRNLPDQLLESDGKLLGYAYCQRSNGITLLKPYLSMDVPDGADAIMQLIDELFSDARSILLVQASDQHWMTESLFSIGHQALPREELLVKHFAVMEKVPITSLNKAQNGRQSDTVRPMIPSQPNVDN